MCVNCCCCSFQCCCCVCTKATTLSITSNRTKSLIKHPNNAEAICCEKRLHTPYIQNSASVLKRPYVPHIQSSQASRVCVCSKRIFVSGYRVEIKQSMEFDLNQSSKSGFAMKSRGAPMVIVRSSTLPRRTKSSVPFFSVLGKPEGIAPTSPKFRSPLLPLPELRFVFVCSK